MRAYNDGRYMETEVRLAESGKGLTWGFTIGQIKTSSTLAINEKGEWTEVGEVTIGTQPPRKFLELTVRRETLRNSPRYRAPALFVGVLPLD